MNKNQRQQGIIVSYITMAFNFAIGLVFTPFITSMLGKSEYGLYNIASSIITYLTMLDLGLGNSMVRFTSRAKARQNKEEESKINGLFLIMFSIISLIALVIGIVIYFNIEPFFTKFTVDEIQKAKTIFLILLINICVSFPFTIVSAQLSANERFSFLKMWNLITNAAKYALEAIVMASGFKSVGVAAAAVIVSITSKIFPIIYCKRNLEIKFSFNEFDKKIFKQILSYSSFIFINILVDQLYANTDKIILGKVIGTAAVAVYGTASTLSKDFMQLSTSISGVFLPGITKLVAKKVPIKEISDIFIRVARIQFYVIGLAFCGFFIFGKQFITFWVGDAYADAYYITLILMAPGVISLTQNIGVSVLQAMNKHRIRSVMYLGIAILNIGISIPLSIKWSGIGAAIGTLIGNILGQILFMNWYYGKKIGLDIPGYWKKVFFRMGSVYAVYTAIWYYVWNSFKITTLIQLLTGMAVYIIILAPILWFLVANASEKALVLSAVSKIKLKLKKAK